MRIYPLIFKTKNEQKSIVQSTPSAFLDAGVPTFNLLFHRNKSLLSIVCGRYGSYIPIGGKEFDASEMLYNDEYLPAPSTVSLHLADFLHI